MGLIQGKTSIALLCLPQYQHVLHRNQPAGMPNIMHACICGNSEDCLAVPGNLCARLEHTKLAGCACKVSSACLVRIHSRGLPQNQGKIQIAAAAGDKLHKALSLTIPKLKF